MWKSNLRWLKIQSYFLHPDSTWISVRDLCSCVSSNANIQNDW
nr:hypothetical protein HmN_000178000 [Hymenolepis microstoma]